MRTIVAFTLVTCITILASCSSAKRIEAKRKKEQEKMEQLESDKKQFELKNRNELGK